MGTAIQTPYLFTPKPVFGLDIGAGSLKVMQLDLDAGSKGNKSKPKLVGYGATNFDKSAVKEGVIDQPEVIAKAAKELFKQGLVGDITTRRVAIAIPTYRTFTRSIQLPPLKASERADAVSLEAEQYLPVPLSEVYLDYTTIHERKDGSEVLAVAVPKNVVDSYLDLTAIMGLEPVLIETTMSASGRMFGRDNQSDVASLLIDFGSVSSDISIYDNGIITAGTVEGGGQVFTNVIQKALRVSDSEARVIKIKYGLGASKRQAEIHAALEPVLDKIVTEVKRLIRYHSERYNSDRPIQQIITLGGGANMPGLSEYFINKLRIAVRACDPWQYVDHKGIQVPHIADRPMYTTAFGLAFANPVEVLKK